MREGPMMSGRVRWMHDSDVHAWQRHRVTVEHGDESRLLFVFLKRCLISHGWGAL